MAEPRASIYKNPPSLISVSGSSWISVSGSSWSQARTRGIVRNHVDHVLIVISDVCDDVLWIPPQAAWGTQQRQERWRQACTPRQRRSSTPAGDYPSGEYCSHRWNLTLPQERRQQQVVSLLSNKSLGGDARCSRRFSPCELLPVTAHTRTRSPLAVGSISFLKHRTVGVHAVARTMASKISRRTLVVLQQFAAHREGNVAVVPQNPITAAAASAAFAAAAACPVKERGLRHFFESVLRVAPATAIVQPGGYGGGVRRV